MGLLNTELAMESYSIVVNNTAVAYNLFCPLVIFESHVRISMSRKLHVNPGPTKNESREELLHH
jgi:hypothetical protein